MASKVQRVLQVSAISLAVLKSPPPRLILTATGIASTAGWTHPRLDVRSLDAGIPADGYVDFDFVADPPGGLVAEVLTPITATAVWGEYGRYEDQVKGVRVHAKANAAEAQMADPSHPPSVQLQVDLPMNEPVSVPEACLTLTLAGIVDHRCPSNVVCVWAGFVEATVEAKPDGVKSEQVVLSSLNTEPVALSSGHYLSLINVLPYPVFRKTAPHEPTPMIDTPIATVMVMKP